MSFNFKEFLGLSADASVISTWPELGDGRKVRIFVTGPDLPGSEEKNAVYMAYIRKAVTDFFDELDEGVSHPVPDPVPGFKKVDH